MKTEIKETCLEFSKKPNVAGFVFKDKTIYSQSDKERIPTVFETVIGTCRITVLCGHVQYPDSWLFHCYELGFDKRLLDVKTAQEAAGKAIDICRTKINSLYKAFNP